MPRLCAFPQPTERICASLNGIFKVLTAANARHTAEAAAAAPAVMHAAYGIFRELALFFGCNGVFRSLVNTPTLP